MLTKRKNGGAPLTVHYGKKLCGHDQFPHISDTDEAVSSHQSVQSALNPKLHFQRISILRNRPAEQNFFQRKPSRYPSGLPNRSHTGEIPAPYTPYQLFATYTTSPPLTVLSTLIFRISIGMTFIGFLSRTTMSACLPFSRLPFSFSS